MNWPNFIKGAVGVLLVVLSLALVFVTAMIMLGNGEERLQGLGADILVPTLTAVLGLLVAVAGVKAAATVWYNVNRKPSDNPISLALFEW